MCSCDEERREAKENEVNEHFNLQQQYDTFSFRLHFAFVCHRTRWSYKMDGTYISRFEFGIIPDVFVPKNFDTSGGRRMYRDLSSHEFTVEEKMWLCEEIVQEHMSLITGDISALSSMYNIPSIIIKEWLRCYHSSHPFAKNQIKILAKQFHTPQIARPFAKIAQRERIVDCQKIRIRSGSSSYSGSQIWSSQP